MLTFFSTEDNEEKAMAIEDKGELSEVLRMKKRRKLAPVGDFKASYVSILFPCQQQYKTEKLGVHKVLSVSIATCLDHKCEV